MPRNDMKSLKDWVEFSTETVKDEGVKRVMVDIGMRMVDAGYLRGDITWRWLDTFSTKHTEQMRDLYR